MNLKLLNKIKASGLRQWQIAKRAGISEVRLSKLVNESGAPPKVIELLAISKALNCKPSELFQTCIQETQRGGALE